jgi:hypothetical protein
MIERRYPPTDSATREDGATSDTLDGAAALMAPFRSASVE